MYNRSEIMKAAWGKHNRNGMTFSTALRLAWREAKDNAPIHKVIGYRIGSHCAAVLGQGLTYDQAGRIEWLNKCSYDRIEIKAA